MKKMRRSVVKKTICGVLLSGLLLSEIPVISVTAAPKKKEIDTIEKLEEVLEDIEDDGIITEKEKKEVINNLEEEIAIDYLNKKNEEIDQIVNNLEGKLVKNDYDSKTDTYTEIREYKIDDDITVFITNIDEPVQKMKLTGDTLLSFCGVSVSVGQNRNSTNTHTENLLGWTYLTFKLILNYTVNSSNLKANYITTSGSGSIGTLTTSAYIVNSTASSKGKKLSGIGSYNISAAGYATVVQEYKVTVEWSTSDSNGRPKYTFTNFYRL